MRVLSSKRSKLKKIITWIKNVGVLNVFLFILITLSIHFIWKIWEMELNYYPLSQDINMLLKEIAKEVQFESTWLFDNVIGYKIVTESTTIYLPNMHGISIGETCSGLKQIIQFVVLLIIYPGPWIKKIWFIPLGVLILHITNVLRIIMLGIVAMNIPEYMEFVHVHPLRWIYYVVIFGLWLVWDRWIKTTDIIKTQES